MRTLVLILLSAFPGIPGQPLLAAQEKDTSRVDTARVDSMRTDSALSIEIELPAPPVAPAPPPPPTPEQERYLDGLRRVGRGISQLKIAVDQATRAQAGTDSVARRRATRRLGGYCGSARSFMSGGRAQMQPAAYEDTTRLKARRLTQRVDEIISYTRTCEEEANGAPQQVMGEISKRLQAYDTALTEFRVSVGMQSDTTANP